MPRSRLVAAIAFLAAFSAASNLMAQDVPADRPAALPAAAPSKAERDRAEAATLYGLGALSEGRHRLLEALRCYEEACKLDANAVPPRKALVPLYLALDRLDDALATARRVLELDPEDWETGALCARQLRARGKPKESAVILRRAVVSGRLKDKPDAHAQLWADLAVLEEDTGEWQQAASALTKLADLLDHPAPFIEQESLNAEEAAARAAETYESLGRVWLKAGDTARAVAAFETSRRRDPSRAGRLALHLAEIHDRAGRPREALAPLDEYLAARPAGTEAYEMKIRLLNQLGEKDKIVPALTSASEADPHNNALALLLARELCKAGDESSRAVARQIYRRLIPMPEAYRGIFELFKKQGDQGERAALGMLNRAIKEANPTEQPEVAPAANPRRDSPESRAAQARAMLLALRDDPAAVQMLLNAAKRSLSNQDDLHPDTRLLLAALAERTQQLDIAEELYRTCLTRPIRPEGGQASVYSGLLTVLLKARKYEDVVKLCKHGLERAGNVNRTLFFLYLSEAQLALGQFDDALASANQAVEVADPENRLQCQRHRAGVLSRMERHADAIAACQEMLREYNQPQKEEDALAQQRQAAKVRDVRLLLSLMYSTAQQPEKSEEQLRLILDADPDNVQANNNLGFQWAERGMNLPEAERLIRKAIELDRLQRSTKTAVGMDSDLDNAAYIDSLGWVLFRKGDLKGARVELEKAVKLPDGDDPAVWDHLADVLFRLGEKDKATAAWQKALKLFDTRVGPKDERYKEIQQKLKQAAP